MGRVFHVIAATCLAAKLLATPVAAQVVGTPGAPSAFGLSQGGIAAALSGSYENRSRGGLRPTRFDASSSILIGFGDPVDGIGFQMGTSITSFRDFGAAGYFTLGAHKMFQTSEHGLYSVAANLDYLAPWGEARENKPSGNLLLSYMTGFGPRLGLVTLGVANNTRSDRRPVGVFGMGVGISDETSISFAQLGERSTIGLTAVPAVLRGATLSVGLSRDWGSRTSLLTVDIGRSFNMRRK
ncbi:MAG: hypothetical protein EA407_12325 [Rhodobacteraceae bacterium]|nr:MAG: hypothetical protein EA407_12325 [Paracoccaceae bacterium]